MNSRHKFAMSHYLSLLFIASDTLHTARSIVVHKDDDFIMPAQRQCQAIFRNAAATICHTIYIAAPAATVIRL